MNTDEKKALVKFLVIYIGSALLLIAIMLFSYYKNEVKMLKENCNMWLSNESMKLKSEILSSYKNNKEFNPSKLENSRLKYALYDENKKLIFSYLDGSDYIDFDKIFYTENIFDFYVLTLNEANIPIKYIVMETCKGYENTNKLKIFIAIAFVLSVVFVGLIAYFLAKTLLKPARNRVETLDKFIKDSAHELNTPISVLMTSVSMLKKGKNPEKMMKYILSSSKQISQIYNDMHFSAFNEINEDIKELFNLKDLISESVDFFTDIAITKNIKFVVSLEDCFIKMDKTKTQKLINNLLSNSIKYSNKDSEIIVNLKEYILVIEDFGIGIEQSEQKDIFKRYKRGENNEGGFGIGLDIVNRICEEYKLKIELISQKNKGSKFIIDLSSVIIK